MSVPQTGKGPEEGGLFDPGVNNLQFNYVLLLVSIGIGLTAIVAVILAYIGRGKLGGYTDTHYRYQIATFWMGLVYSVIAAIGSVIGLGFILFPLIAVWLVVRCVKGLQRIARREPIDNPATWLW